ncbi:MAG: zinc ribbon domain-containing protein, partial [Gemmatimonadota bacterium]|nr:zinc ribbon domain-containing protein [Gemmatimonadota bacterium]
RRTNPDAESIIPIYEYSCQDCGNDFEALIRGDAKAVCPECESQNLERAFSLPTVHSSGTHEMAMRAARKRDKRQGEERMHTQREYELNHDDH